MSKVIDDRVVQMEFDNSKFESNVKTTMTTLEKLKQALNFKGAQDGAKNAASNMSTLSSAVQTIGSRFSTMEVIGVTALANIANKAVNAGEQLLKSLTIEPITSGFKEYELKMDSIRTIMASTGESLETVNGYLDELNKYSDETIYSFSDMTENIGKFTNAGVKLDKAVLAIKGVANEAAMSGANANEASRAMYNFAQALSAGYVKLIDWKSIENANMATVKFKEQLIDTAVEVGTLTKQADGMYKVLTTNASGSSMKEAISATQNFNDSLAYQWMTTEVLTNTLAKYADTTTDIGAKAQKAATEVSTFSKMMDTLQEAAGSGWAETWQTIIGDREQATNLFTVMTDGISDIISKSADARNNMLKMVMNDSWEKLSSKITDTGIKLETFEERSKQVAKQHDIDVEKMITKEGSFAASLKNGWLTTDIFRETLNSLISGTTDASTALEQAGFTIEGFNKIVNSVIRGDWGNGAARMKSLTDAGYDYATMQSMVNKVMAGGKIEASDLEDALKNLSDSQLKSAGLTDEQVRSLRSLEVQAKYSGTSVSELINNLSRKSGRELLFETVQNSITGLSKSLSAIRKAWNNVFPSRVVSERIYNIMDSIEKLSEKFDFSNDTAKKITTTFQGLFNILDLIRMVVGGGVSLAFQVLKQVMENLNINILDITSGIGAAITKFHDWVTENGFIATGIKMVADALTSAILKVSSWVNAVRNLPSTSVLIGRVVSNIGSGFTKVQDYFSGATERITAFIERVKNMDKISIANIGAALDDFGTNVLGYFIDFDQIGSKLESIWTKFKEFVDKIKSGGDSAKEAVIGLKDSFVENVSSFVDTVGEKLGLAVEDIETFKNNVVTFLGEAVAFIQNLPWGSIAAIGGIGALLYVINNIAKAFEQFGGILGTVTEIVERYTKAYATEAKAKKINAIANVIKSLGIAVVAVAAGMWIVVNALQELEKVDLSWSFVGKLAMVVGAIAALLFASKFSGGKFNGVGLLAMVLGVKLFIELMDDIMKVDSDAVLANIDKFGEVLAGITALLLASNLGSWKGGVGLLAMSAGLMLLLGVVKVASMMDQSTIDSGLSKLESMGIFIATFMAVSRLGKNAAKAGAGILLLSISLGLLIGCIKLISFLTDAEIDRGVKTLTKLTLLMDSMILVSGKAKKVKPGVFIALAASVAVMTMCLAALSAIDDEEGLKNATRSLSTVMGVFALMEYMAGTVSKKTSKGAIAELAIIVALFAGVLIAMSQWANVEALIPSATALSELLLAFSVSLGIISKFGSEASLSLTNIGLMLLVVAGLGAVLTLMSQRITNVDALLPIAASLSIMLITFTGVLAVLSVIGPYSSGAVAGLESLGLVVSAIIAFMVLVGGINELCPDLEYFLNSGISILNQVAAGIGEFVGNLISGVGVGITDGLPAIGENIKGFADSLSGVDSGAAEAASAIAGAVLALSAANVLDGLGNILQFIGGSSDANSFGQSLSALGEAMKSFCSSISGLSDDSVGKAEMAAGIMGAMTDVANTIPKTGGIIQKIAGESDIKTFAQSMTAAASCIIAFNNRTSSFTEDQIEKANIAAGIIDAMSNVANGLPKHDGIIQKIAGESDIKTFAQSMDAASACIIAFNNRASSFTEDQIEKANIAASIIEAMSEVATKLPKEKGIIQKIAGEQNIRDFGQKMSAAGTSIKDFNAAIQDVTTVHVERAGYAVSIVEEMKSMATAAQNILERNVNWENFNTKVAANLGDALKSFTSAFLAINNDDVSQAESAVKLLEKVSDIATFISGGNVITGESAVVSFKAFCVSLSEAGPSIKKFVQGITGITTSQVSNAVSIVQQLGEMSSDLGSYDFTKLNAMADGLSKLSSISLDGFGAGIQNGGKEIGSAVSSMMSSMTGSITASSGDVSSAVGKVISRSIQTAQAMSPKFHSIGTLFIQKLAEGITASTPVASASTLKLILRVLSVGDNQTTKFYALGQSFIESLASGISSRQSLVIAAVQNICSGGVSGARSYYDSYYYAGENMVQGFANGIRNGTYLAVSASTDMAKKSLQAAKKILNEHSPSKEMYKIGAYASEGFANGITSYGSKVYTVSEKVANNALEAMSAAVTTINQALLNDMDTTPTIRPVVDLGGVKSGIGSIRSIFDNSNLTSYANVKSASRLMNAGSYKYGDGDIVKAVNDLKTAVLDAAGNTYQINGITYDDGSSIGDAVKALVNAARIERRI